MTVYLVKWEDGTFALVAAVDEDDLIDRLDQLADPGVATWQEYEGPLWLEFPRVTVPAEGDVGPEEIRLPAPSAAETDDGFEMTEAILAAVHPNLKALQARAFEEDRAISRDELDAALAADEGCGLAGSGFGPPAGTS